MSERSEFRCINEGQVRTVRTVRGVRTVILVAAFIIVSSVSALAQTSDQLSNVKGLVDQARASFEQLDYENTVKALDSAIGAIEARPTPEVRRLMPAAYDMRARALFGLGKENEARADFVSLLKADPWYVLSGQLSPRIIAMFDELLKTTVTELQLTITPADAEVLLDGNRVPSSGTMPLAVGDHTLSVSRIGYRATTHPFTAVAGAATVVDSLALERVATVFRFVTAPSGVEVLIDGISHGTTKPGPPPAEYAERAARAGVPASELSAVLTVTELPVGAHRISFRKDCYVSTRAAAERRAARRLRARSGQARSGGGRDVGDVEPAGHAGARRRLAARRGADDHSRCVRRPAPRRVEVGSGRYFQRIDARTGQKITVEGTLRPAFALVSASGPAALNTDLRMTIEKQFQSSQSVTMFAPAAEAAAKALAADKLPQDWLAFDANKRPLGTAAEVNTVMRGDLSARLSRQFDAQGIASVTVPSATNRNRLVVSLLASGSADPDVIEIDLDSPDASARAVGRLDRGLSFFKPTLGVTVVDVADLEGPVVVAVDPNGPAAKAGVQPGDVVLRANSQPVPDAAALTTLLAGRKADEDMTLDLKDKAGAAKKSDVKVFMTPRLIGLNDQSLLINKILVDLRGRLRATRRSRDRLGDAVEPGRGARARRRLVGGPARAAAREVERWPRRVCRHRAVPARTGRGANGQQRRSRGGLAGGRGQHGVDHRRRTSREGPGRGPAAGPATPPGPALTDATPALRFRHEPDDFA